MQINFNELYQNYSNTELLQITHQPELYQPNAVSAAQEILKNRTITNEDLATTMSMQDSKIQTNKTTVKAKGLVNRIFYFVPSMAISNTWAGKSMALIILLLALQLAWLSYTLGKYILYIPTSMLKSYSLNGFAAEMYYGEFPFITAALASLFFSGLTFYKLITKNKWGWMLLFVTASFLFITYICQIIFIGNTDQSIQEKLVPTLSTILSAFVLFTLWQKEIVRYFNVSSRNKESTLLIALLISGAFAFFILIPHMD
jgi:hypothetical protein